MGLLIFSLSEESIPEGLIFTFFNIKIAQPTSALNSNNAQETTGKS
jgi:hypothetical protein